MPMWKEVWRFPCRISDPFLNVVMQDICSRRELFDHSTWQPKAFVQAKPQKKMFTLTLGKYELSGESSISKCYKMSTLLHTTIAIIII